MVESLSGGLAGLSAEQVGQNFGSFLATPGPMVAWHFAFTAVTILIVSRGVQRGLEPLVKLVMPALLITLLALSVYSALTGEFLKALEFLFKPDFSVVTAGVVLAAVGQAFFFLNVGLGAVLTYSAYLPTNVNIARSAFFVACGDTLVALLAGLAIFPIVFAYG